MNKNELAELIKEWIHSRPEDRRRFEVAISEQYRKAKESLWEGHKEDSLSIWIAKCCKETFPHAEALLDDLMNRLAEHLERQDEEISQKAYVEPMPVAAYRPPAKAPERAVIPDEEEIRKTVGNILNKLDSIK